MEKRIKLLMLEDSKEDAEIIRNELSKTGFDFVIKLVDNKTDFEKTLIEFEPEIILSDYLMPGFNGLAALKLVKEKALDIPYIFVSGHIGEDLAIEALHNGATDYVLKDKLSKLNPTIIRVLKEKEEKQKVKEIEIELRESEEKYRTIVNSLNIILFIFDFNGIIKFVQGKGLESLNLKVENLIGSSIKYSYKKIKIQTNEGIIISGEEAFHNVLEGNVVHGISNFQNRYFEIKLVPQKNEIYNRVVGIVNDITELVELNDRLKESEERYRNIYENAPIGILSFSNNGKLLNANPAFQNILGFDESELQNLSISDLTFNDDFTVSNNNFTEMKLNKKDLVQFEKRYVKKNKEVIWANVTASAIRDEKKNFLYTITMVEDITNKKNAENEIKESEERFRQLAENISEVFWMSDPLKEKIIYVSPSYEKIWGKPRNQLYENSKIWIDSILKEDWEKIGSNYIERQNNNEYDVEYRIINSDGKIRWIRDRAFPILNDKKEVYRIAGIAADITEVKNAIEQIINAKEKAEEADKLKSEFLAQMSHEIRTPINTILNYNSLIKEELLNQNGIKWASAFNSIDIAGKRLIRTIDLILNMSMIQSGKVEINSEYVNMYSLLIQLVNEFKIIAQEKKLELNLNNISMNTIINSDEYIVTQIFQNLIDNAIKYTKQGKVEVNVYNNDENKLCVDIKDTGIGISEKYLLQIFEPFTQEDTGYSRRYEGVGLGLALVKNYAHLIHAKITVESEKNKGSVFRIIFN